MKKVTIQDIADELGVSRNTVSKAINNAEGLAEATRARILQKAIEMGYKQFSYIRAQAGAASEQENQSKGEIALLIGDAIDASHFASLMLDKLKRELSQWGYTLITHRVERDNFLCRTLPFTFSPQDARAIICIEMFDRAYDEMICTLGLPVVFVDGPHKRDGIDLPADQLYMDNTTAITRFVNDMLVRGKRCTRGRTLLHQAPESGAVDEHPDGHGGISGRIHLRQRLRGGRRHLRPAQEGQVRAGRRAVLRL